MNRQQKVKGWLDKASEVDATEDAEHGPDRRGDETPGWMADKQQRLARSRAARAALEAEAMAAAAAKEAARPDPGTRADGTPSKRRGPKPTRAPGIPELTAQRTFTDPESRIMLGRDGFIQVCNGQAAVDGKRKVIVAHRLTQNAADQDGLLPCWMRLPPTPGACPTRCQPTMASARKPVSRASSNAACGATSPPDAPGIPPTASQVVVR